MAEITPADSTKPDGSRADDAFRQRMQRIEVLVQELNALPDPVARSGAVELLQAVLELHGTGLERILATIHGAGAAGSAIVEQMLQDDLVGSLLLLHDLHPHDPETRMRQALDRLRPHLGVQGGRVELLGLDGGIARVQIEQTGHGMSAAAQEELVRQAILAAAPEVTDVLVERAAGGGGSFIPLSSILKSSTPNPVGAGLAPPAPTAAPPAPNAPSAPIALSVPADLPACSPSPAHGGGGWGVGDSPPAASHA